MLKIKTFLVSNLSDVTACVSLELTPDGELSYSLQEIFDEQGAELHFSELEEQDRIHLTEMLDKAVSRESLSQFKAELEARKYE